MFNEKESNDGTSIGGIILMALGLCYIWFLSWVGDNFGATAAGAVVTVIIVIFLILISSRSYTKEQRKCPLPPGYNWLDKEKDAHMFMQAQGRSTMWDDGKVQFYRCYPWEYGEEPPEDHLEICSCRCHAHFKHS